MNPVQNKKRIISLLTMPKKKMLKLSEESLLGIIEEVDEIRLESVNDRRFLDAENSK